MIISEVLLVVGALVVAMFGFLNGWLFRRLVCRDDGLSVDDASIYPGPGSARWANGPRAVLLPTREHGEIETAHARGLTAVATFDRVVEDEPAEPRAGQAAPTPAAAPQRPVDRDEPPRALDLPELARCEQRISGLVSVLGELEEMVTTFDHRGDLERRIEARERRRRMRRLDRSPSISAVA